MFKFSGRAVHLVSHYMASGDIRYYLNGVYAEPAPGGGAFIVASCGHMMAVYLDETAVCPEPILFTLSKGAVAALKPARTTCEQFLEINSVTGRLTVFGKEVARTRMVQRGRIRSSTSNGPIEELYLQPGQCFLEGKFPDWKKVFKPFVKGEKVDQFNVNSAYLAKFFTSIKAHAVNFNGVTMHFKSPTDAVIMACDQLENFRVLIMPVRLGGTPRMPAKIEKVLINYGQVAA